MKLNKRVADRQITPDSNCRLVRDKDFGNILFGCPPEVIKSFYGLKETIPSNIVIPQRVFRKGRNIFDMEFITYSVIFSQKSKRTLDIICTETQEKRIRSILQEALFGPLFENNFASFLFDSIKNLPFNKRQTVSFNKFIHRMGINKDIFSKFKEIMSLKLNEDKVVLKMQPVLRPSFEKVPWLKNFAKNKIYKLIATAYVRAAMLKLEMNIFSLCDEAKGGEFIDKIISFHHFDEKGTVTMLNNGSRLKIWQTRHGIFKLYKGGKLWDTVDLKISEKKQESWKAAKAPFESPQLGFTFLGSGTGFDPKTYTSSYLIWIDGKAMGVDLLANCEEHFMRHGIASNDVTHIFLSHMHADHDAGIIEKIMWGEKSYLLTSRPIFDSFLRKTEALTSVDQDSIKNLVNFVNLEPGKEIPIPGIDRAYITFDYSFHSIPSGRFRLRYRTLNGREVTIGFSGDTRYDKSLVNKVFRSGIITNERRKGILGFIWDCDHIVHEAGGGLLHTRVEELLNLPAAKKRKLILTHADHKTRLTKGLRFGHEGETINIFSNKYPVPAHSVQNFIPLIKKTGLFSKLSSKEFKFLLENVEIETFSRGKYIFKQGEIGDKFYILLSGFAEVIKNNQVISIYEKGSFFGELALINRDRIRRASIRAKSKLLVMSMARECYKKFHLTTNIRERLYEFTNFFSESSLSSLVGYMSRGEFVVFMEGDDIIHYGDQDNDIYILLSGEVDILDYREKIIAHISNVEIFGEMAFLKEIPRTATVRVTSHEAATICFKPNLFKEISEKFPSFNATALKKMEQRWEMLKRKKQWKK